MGTITVTASSETYFIFIEKCKPLFNGNYSLPENVGEFLLKPGNFNAMLQLTFNGTISRENENLITALFFITLT